MRKRGEFSRRSTKNKSGKKQRTPVQLIDSCRTRRGTRWKCTATVRCELQQEGKQTHG
uniref:Uncharacterized protein n=1 Tax=Anopheles arabiensis TaxID=7173 RepID=A0A182HIE9_ANOAR